MFKRSCISLIVFMLLMLAGPFTARAAETNNVKDYLNYLTGSEAQQLQSSIDKVKSNYGLDVVVVITDKTDGKSSMAFADDYYDNNGYGVGIDHSGLLMLVNMGKREVWISTTGKAIDIFTDSRISSMVDHVTKPLSSQKYYDACSTFIYDVTNYAAMGVPSGQYRVDDALPKGSSTYLQRVFALMNSFIVYIIALVISVSATIFLSLSSKGKVTTTSRTYEKEDSFVLSDSRDDFVREFTTRTKIESSSNRSSTHSGSSGRSHGGGGGRF